MSGTAAPRRTRGNVAGMTEVDGLLAEQLAYYRARAGEYDEEYVDHPELLGPDATVAGLDIGGDVLELACGTGQWTARLAARAESLTAVDGAPEMLAIAAERTAGRPVRYERADLFEWRPDRRYDVVFFAFWLSHVPPERFDAFWAMVAEALRPGGRVMFVDDGPSTAEQESWLAEATALRTVRSGAEHRIVKIPVDAAWLGPELARLGWTLDLRPITGGHVVGIVTRATADAAGPA